MLLRELNKTFNKLHIKTIRSDFKNTVSEMLADYFKDKTIFKEKNISLYYFDEYELKTNVFENVVNTLYVEINQPLNIKPEIENLSKRKRKNNIVPDLYLTLENIKNDLFQKSVQTFSNNALIWQTKYAINFSINLANEKDGTPINYIFKIIPCLRRTNNLVNGVLYYSNSKREIQIEYPKISIKNFNKKNIKTEGIFLKTVCIFKNIFLLEKKCFDLPFEIFEIVLYNVPNQFFKEESIQDLLNIINYLRNKNIRDYVSLDEQDKAFISIYKSLSIHFTKHLISIVEKYIKNNKKSL